MARMARQSGRRVAWTQLALDAVRRPSGRGGWRPGAGRPRGRTTCSHATRPRFAASSPVHVTLRVVPGLRSLRRDDIARIVRDAITLGGHRPDFRVVEFNLLRNHLHLLVEAHGAASLARGMQGLAIRLAKRINARLHRRGTCFAERYHARALHTPRDVRNVLRYILLNARHHAAQYGRALPRHWLDPFSSAPWFTGFRDPIAPTAPWLRARLVLPRPTASPRTWLLTTAWRRGGPIPVDDIPGAPP